MGACGARRRARGRLRRPPLRLRGAAGAGSAGQRPSTDRGLRGGSRRWSIVRSSTRSASPTAPSGSGEVADHAKRAASSASDCAPSASGDARDQVRRAPAVGSRPPGRLAEEPERPYALPSRARAPPRGRRPRPASRPATNPSGAAAIASSSPGGRRRSSGRAAPSAAGRAARRRGPRRSARGARRRRRPRRLGPSSRRRRRQRAVTRAAGRWIRRTPDPARRRVEAREPLLEPDDDGRQVLRRLSSARPARTAPSRRRSARSRRRPSGSSVASTT